MSRCGGCGADLSLLARFCSSCGTAVAATSTVHEPADAAASAVWPEGERRHLTLMFCDLVGSTALGQQLDVEDYTELIEAYVTRAAGAIGRFDGYVAQIQGDGIVAYFGYPVAHEDDAERAVSAGLEIQAELSERGVGNTDVGALVRIGIHTGIVVVVVNELGQARRELLALGDAANTAARIESMTPPGRVGVSEATSRLVRDRFVLTDSGDHRAKGIELPVRLYLVEGPTRLAGRGEARATELFGRDEPLANLARASAKMRAGGAGTCVALIGEPGIGKSHLAAHFLEGTESAGWSSVTIGCSALGASTAFGPIIELVHRCLELVGGASGALPTRLEALGVDGNAGIAHLLDLAGFPADPNRPLPTHSAELRRASVVEAVEALVAGLSRAVPFVVLCEDVQWADPSTLEVLGRLARACPKLPLLLLVTSRPGAELPDGVESIVVDRLDAASARSLVRKAAGTMRLGDKLVEQLVGRAEGVPLFLEQLTAAVVESGSAIDLEPGIPQTLQESLAARLDRLGPARALAQIASLLGRELDRDVLGAVSGLQASELDEQLAALAHAGILNSHDGQRYTFRHALIQDAAASSLVRRTRRRLHGEVVDVLTRSFPAVVDAEPANLAHHCVEAGRGLAAIGHYRRAAALATSRFANHEAAELLGRALDQHESLDPAEKTRLLEIEIRSEYGGALSGVHGLLGDPVVANYRRIEALEEESPDLGDRLAALLALTAWYPQVSEMRSLMTAGQRLLDIAGELEMPLFEAIGHLMLGLGGTSIEILTAINHLTEVEALAAQGHLPPPFSEYSPDLLVLAVATKSIILCTNGQLAAGRERIEFALHRAETELVHPFSMGTALTLVATQHAFREEPEQCAEAARRAIALALRHGFSNFEAMNRVHLGWTITAAGGDGSDEVRTGLKLLETATLSSSVHQRRMAAAEALLRGCTDEARAHIKYALAMIERNGEVGHLPHVWGTSAKIEMAEGNTARAGEILREAIRFSTEWGSTLGAFQSAVLLLELQGSDDPEALAAVREIYPRLLGSDDLPAVIKVRSLL